MRLKTMLRKEVIYYMDKKPIKEVSSITGLSLKTIEAQWLAERGRRARLAERIAIMECVAPNGNLALSDLRGEKKG